MFECLKTRAPLEVALGPDLALAHRIGETAAEIGKWLQNKSLNFSSLLSNWLTLKMYFDFDSEIDHGHIEQNIRFKFQIYRLVASKYEINSYKDSQFFPQTWVTSRF